MTIITTKISVQRLLPGSTDSRPFWWGKSGGKIYTRESMLGVESGEANH